MEEIKKELVELRKKIDFLFERENKLKLVLKMPSRIISMETLGKFVKIICEDGEYLWEPEN